jgi:hypothetical protein
MRCLILALCCMGAAGAATINPVSYDTRNGDGQASSGSYNYWDLSYSGSGNTSTDAAPLSGGLGDLTDGVIAAQNWLFVENGSGTGPYVGWRRSNGVPVITFKFSGNFVFSSMTLYLDDSDGNGGVDLPASADVAIGPWMNNFLIGSQAGGDPKAITLNLGGKAGDEVEVTLNYANEWIFLSEVAFDGRQAAVPEASTFALCGAGLALAALLSRRR